MTLCRCDEEQDEDYADHKLIDESVVENHYTCNLNNSQSSIQQDLSTIESKLDTIITTTSNHTSMLQNENELLQNDTTKLGSIQGQIQDQSAVLEQILNATQALMSEISNNNNFDFSKTISSFSNCLFNCALNTTLHQNETSIVVGTLNSTIIDTPMQQENITLEELQYCYNNVTITLTNSLGCSSLLNKVVTF